jgi:hypothetical protein
LSTIGLSNWGRWRPGLTVKAWAASSWRPHHGVGSRRRLSRWISCPPSRHWSISSSFGLLRARLAMSCSARPNSKAESWPLGSALHRNRRPTSVYYGYAFQTQSHQIRQVDVPASQDAAGAIPRLPSHPGDEKDAQRSQDPARTEKASAEKHRCVHRTEAQAFIKRSKRPICCKLTPCAVN